jgi:uncharacterized protein (TIGR03083 family)
MLLQPPTQIDTRSMFRPVSSGLVTLLRGLPPAGWEQPTVAGAWLVRDIVAHLLDVTLRRLSFHRDGMAPPPPSRPINSASDFVAFINGINAQWVGASKRLSPRVLVDAFERASAELADWFESQPLGGPALFGVSWAGEQTSENWFDIGREFTELWHHQQQIRLAIGAAGLADPRFLHAVIGIAVRGLPHAYRNVPADPGQRVVLQVSGPAGGQWTLLRGESEWTLWQGEADEATACIALADDSAWKLLFNALPASESSQAVRITGSVELAAPLMRARSVIV